MPILVSWLLLLLLLASSALPNLFVVFLDCLLMTSTSELNVPTAESTGPGADDDSILTVLHTTTDSKCASGSTRARQDYESRLLSFQASTYWAKPACLSPLLCARFGWCNADRDMLCCSSCKAAVAVTFPPGLSAKATEGICSEYRQRLANAHKHHCPFRLEAEQFFRSTPTPKSAVTFPAAFASVLPQETVKLLEHPSPSQLLKKTIHAMEDRSRMRTSEPQSWEFPKLEIADVIQSFSVTIRNGIKIPAVDAVSVVAGWLGTKHTPVVLAAILGWTPINVKSDIHSESQNPVVSLGCPLCFAMMELSLKKSKDRDLDERERANRLSKRQRKLARYVNPHDAHRHYCPIRCGFPTDVLTADMPLWQVLLSRLISEREKKEAVGDRTSEEDHDGEEALSRIRNILMSGIVPKKVELEIDEDDDDEDNIS